MPFKKISKDKNLEKVVKNKEVAIVGIFQIHKLAQSVTCPTTNAFLTACRSKGHEFDPGPVPYFR